MSHRRDDRELAARVAGIEEWIRRIQTRQTALPSDVGDRSHDSLTGITTDNHHNQLHAHDGADGSGVILHGNLGDLAADTHFAYLKNAASPSTPTRALGTTFTPSALRSILGLYTVRIACAASETGRVELRSENATPPTIIRCQARLAVGAVGDAVAADHLLAYLIPPDHKVRLETFQESGTPTFTLVRQTEVLL